MKNRTYSDQATGFQLQRRRGFDLRVVGIVDRHGHELEFPSAFRQSRRDGKPRGIIKLKDGGSS